MTQPLTASEVRIDLRSSEGAELRQIKAYRLIRNHTLLAGALGLIPVPILDALLASVVLVRMLRKLAELYGFQFESRQRLYAVFGSLFGGAALPLLLFPAVVSLVKLLPLVGTLAGMIAMPLVLTPAAYALGRTFLLHFEGGGTLLSFDPQELRQVLLAYYADGQRSASAAPASGPGASVP